MSTMIVNKLPLEIIEEVQITEGLVKKIIKHGEGEAPTSGMMCSMHYTGVLTSDDTKFDSSRDRNQPFEFQLGVGQVIKGWDQGVITMRKGEEAVLCLSPDMGYGANGAPPTIPGNASLTFHVELLDFFEKPKQMWEMSEEEKMSFAEDKKREGNAALKEGAFEHASKCYEAGLQSFEGKDVEDLNEVYRALKLSLHSNQCIAMLKTGNYLLAKVHAADVLRMDPTNVKGQFNLIQAFDHLGEFEMATRESKRVLDREDLTEAQRAMFQRQQAAVKARSAAQDKKEKAVYSKMFA